MQFFLLLAIAIAINNAHNVRKDRETRPRLQSRILWVSDSLKVPQTRVHKCIGMAYNSQFTYFSCVTFFSIVSIKFLFYKY